MLPKGATHAVQRVDVGRLEWEMLWLKVYSSPRGKLWGSSADFDGDKLVSML